MINHYLSALVENELEDDAIEYMKDNLTYFADSNALKRILITSYYANKDFGNANSVLNNYSLIDDNDRDFEDLMTILLNADSLNVDLLYFSENELDDIKLIAQNNTEAGYMAKSILRELRGISVNDEPEMWGYEEYESSLVYISEESRPISNNKIADKINLEFSAFEIFPNPANNELNIKSDAGDIEVYDILGKKIYSITKGIDNSKINTQTFLNGVYFVKFKKVDGTQKVLKFIINR